MFIFLKLEGNDRRVGGLSLTTSAAVFSAPTQILVYFVSLESHSGSLISIINNVFVRFY